MKAKESEQNIDLFKKKSKYFYDNKQLVHIKLRDHFANGKIIDIKNDFIIIEEMIEGQKVIFFLEMREIVEYAPKGVRNG